MNFKRTVTGFLSVAVLTVSLGTAQAAMIPRDVDLAKPLLPIKQNVGASGIDDAQIKAAYGSFTGTVKAVEDFEAIKGAKIVAVESQTGGPANFIIKEDTYIVDNFDLNVGVEVTGFYDANAPMIMIYPPQYNVEVLAEQELGQFVKVDLFDQNLVSSDNQLKLNISEKTEVVTKDGKPYPGTLADKKLAVVYDVTTRSIPAQTNPIKVIVLDAEVKAEIGDVAKMEIVVDEQKLAAPKAYLNETKTIMVPLRDIAEALGFPVSWNNDTQSIIIGNGISLKIGDKNYIYYKTAPIKLDTAPELKEGTTYVPLNFFTEVMKMNKAEVSNDKISIENEVI
ncbi:Copper amine oxidase N-terminal domain-containing protein [Desulfonispora thiosulfatigenes DSM 11270]|uniref:Copper amine oxidase N-terminal domain-containing protein n=1 Tax=Desulfonispora thiosulfatigenes DSM 11270 TaxID=656914 RepID=A0A1W1V3E0_DESTI|nr:stalk domain-containing protein [Desulfonispora thiosulfatigenes]SMB87842.1 Copper amine oxidase N-terminal domain-containing protein [Desulfonispora thiosulfatigenes DSM 11270]